MEIGTREGLRVTASAGRNGSLIFGYAPGSEAWLHELEDDLASLGVEPATVSFPETGGRWATRPSVLRRIAAALAFDLPPALDRLVAFGPDARTLGVAVSLETGLPFCGITDENVVIPGELIAGETVALIAVVPVTMSGQLLSVLAAVHIVGALALFRSDAGADAEPPTSASSWRSCLPTAGDR